MGKLGDDETALLYLQQALHSRPWNTVEQKTHALREQSTTLMNLDRFDEAEEAVREALLLKPGDSELLEKLDPIKQLLRWSNLTGHETLCKMR